jgi:hypothetical protein
MRVLVALPALAPFAASRGVSGIGGSAKAAGAAQGVIGGAAAGMALGPVGAIIGGAAGGVLSIIGGGDAGLDPRYKLKAHKAIMEDLIARGEYARADEETERWFAAGQGNASERARFQPSGPRVLPNGKANYSKVAWLGNGYATRAEAEAAAAASGSRVLSAGFGTTEIALLAAGVVAFGLWNLYGSKSAPRRRRAR